MSKASRFDAMLHVKTMALELRKSLRNVTPVAKELVDPNDRRIEKISYRALSNDDFRIIVIDCQGFTRYHGSFLNVHFARFC